MRRTLVLNHLAGSLELLQGNFGLIWEDQDVPVLVPHRVSFSRYMAPGVADKVVTADTMRNLRQLEPGIGCWIAEVVELRQD
jgi:hypothetical protein